METLWWLLCGWRVPWQATAKRVEQKDHGIHVHGFHDPVFRVLSFLRRHLLEKIRWASVDA